MVKSRGIQISIATQIDAKRLAEYYTHEIFNNQNDIARCIVPIIPGAHMWFEYSIDGPHPPDASYFFKLSMNGQQITSWDCTSKHDYHGKATYALQNVKRGQQRAVTQSTFMFSSPLREFDDKSAAQTVHDLFEIKIYRIEYRKRIWNPEVGTQLKMAAGSMIKVVNNGLIDQQRPAKMYQYQLLDPQDKPYATFRFYCKTLQWLEEHNVTLMDENSPTPSVTTGQYRSPSKSVRSTDSPATPTRAGRNTNDSLSSSKSGQCNNAAAVLCSPPVSRILSNESLSTIAKNDLEDSSIKLQSPCSPAITLPPNIDEDLAQSSKRNPSTFKPRFISPSLGSPLSPRRPYQQHRRHTDLNEKTLPSTPAGISASKLSKYSPPHLPPIILPSLGLDLVADSTRRSNQGRRKPKQKATSPKTTITNQPSITQTSPAPAQSFPQTDGSAPNQSSRHNTSLPPDPYPEPSSCPSSRAPTRRPLSPFTSSGFLRHLIRSPRHKRDSTPLTSVHPYVTHSGDSRPSTPAEQLIPSFYASPATSFSGSGTRDEADGSSKGWKSLLSRHAERTSAARSSIR